MINSFEKLSVPQKFVALALAADGYLKNKAVVFHYFGPEKLREHALFVQKGGLKEIIKRLKDLEEEAMFELNDAPPLFRRAHLITQIRSLRALLAFGDQDLCGEELMAAVTAILGVRPPEPFDIMELRSEFRSLLSKYGYSSYDEFRRDAKIFSENSDISDKFILSLIEKLKTAVVEELLPHIFNGNRLAPILMASKIRLVRPSENKPPCYYSYRGGYAGDFCLSPAHRKDKFSVIRTVMHELLPGHHLQSLYREMLYSTGYLNEEATMDLLYGAETTLSEGIAETVPLVMLDSFGDVVKKGLKIMSHAEHYCKKILYNVWFKMFVSRTMTEEKGAEYIRDIGELDDEKVPIWLSFIKEWKIYYPSYPVGISMVGDFLKDSGKEGLRHLYVPKTPSILLRMKSTNERREHEEDSRKAVLCNADMIS